jgi:adenylate cyclase
MKAKLWLLQIPVIVFFVGCMGLSELGIRGDLGKLPWIDHVSWYTQPGVHKLFTKLRGVTTWFTDRKFKFRGPEKPKNKVVIVEVDSDAIDQIGRWPWHRDKLAELIDKTFKAGAKVVGLDIMFSEPDLRMPKELAETLEKDFKHPELVKKYETDRVLANTIFSHIDNLVLGWSSEGTCQPLFMPAEECPVTDPNFMNQWPKFHEHFAVSKTILPPGYDASRSPLVSMATVIPNIPEFSEASEHAGYFNAYPDPDGVVRRTSVFMLGNNKAYPTLTLEMARVGLGESIRVEVTPDYKVKEVAFEKSGRTVPTSPLGAVEYNFRGPGNTFPYIPALDILREDDKIQDRMNRKLAGASKTSLLKDAYALIGVSALGVFDMRSFPFDDDVAGVEGHATLLDNILSDDLLIPSSTTSGTYWIFLFMILGAAAFAGAMQKLEAVPAFVLFGTLVLAFGFFDFHILFANQHTNWDTSFLYLEFAFLFVLTIAAKYVEEENNKKFIRGAFSKYVAPVIVDSILKDPTKLSLGGEKKELTILFSDIRGFTTFSEAMDAKKLSQFLNDYLGIMTKLVFANQGTLDKYIGDAVMAFWGAPLDQPDHAANACKTAIEMMKALRANQARWKEQYGVEVNIGIGINSGPVSVGNMGSDTNFEYTVIGDHVNLASRLEGLTKAYGVGVVTTRFTFDVIKGAGLPYPPHRQLDLVKVKGKKKAVELIEILDKPISDEGLKLFNDAVALYRAQKWDEAVVLFEKAGPLCSVHPDSPDAPCAEYIERCRTFKETPPAPDWDGSWEMHSK